MSESVKATGGNLDGVVKRSFTFTPPVKTAKVQLAPSAPGAVYGRWNSVDASLTDYDFYLTPGDSEYAPPFVRIAQVTLFGTVAMTYETHFSVRGFLEIN